MPRNSTTYFLEDNLAYRRFLCLEPGGRYRQINADDQGAREVDRGAWEQPPTGEVVLRPTNNFLTPRAVSAGPLLVPLDTQAKIDSAPGLRRTIADFLAESRDEIFARAALAELGNERDRTPILSQGGEETFTRGELEELATRLDLWLHDRATGTATFDLLDEPPAPLLLIRRGAVYSRVRLPAVRAAYHTARTAAPPFYFGRIDAETFRRRAGTWRAFDNLGGTHAPDAEDTANP